MGFSDALSSTSTRVYERRLDAILNQLAPEDRKDAETALRDPSISSHRIAVALNKLGFEIAASTIGTWRRGLR